MTAVARANTSFSSGWPLWPWWPPALLAGASALLLIHQWLAAVPLWLDEQMLALNIRERGLLDLTGPLWLNQSAPPAWLALEHLVMRLGGEGERALRTLPLVFGIASIAVAWQAGRRWLGPPGTATLVTLTGLGAWLSYHALELKPYSADAFFGLALPALAGLASEGTPRDRFRRRAWWWAAACAAAWLSNGAIFVAPACMVVLAARAWRTEGPGALPGFVVGAGAWLLSLAALYAIALDAALDNQQLQSYWSFAFPPPSAGIAETTRWTIGQLMSLAAKPGGTTYPALLWAVASIGLAIAVRYALAPAVMLALVPVSMVALDWLRLVPMYERLSLWALPSVYVGVGAAASAGVALVRHHVQDLRPSPLARAAPAALLALAAALVTLDVARVGLNERDARLASTDTNHSLADRDAVSRLLAYRKPGDVVITTRLALPALWWYAGVSVSPPGLGRHLPDGTPILEAFPETASGGCRQQDAQPLLHGHSRALVYFGFRFDDVPPHFDDLLLDLLSASGRVVLDERIAEGGVAVVDLTLPPLEPDWDGPVRPGGTPRPALRALGGCAGLRMAERW